MKSALKPSFLIPAGFALLLFCAPFFSSGQQRTPEKPRRGGVFHIKAFQDKFRTQLDPADPQSSIFLSEQLYDGLVRLDKDFNILPSLAEYWEISPDGKKYTFYLRIGALFHHGREVEAEDVKFSLERLISGQNASAYSQFFLPRVVGAKEFQEGKADEVSGFKVIDKYTLAIEWTKPFVSGLYLLGMHFCKVLPKDEVLERGKGFFRRPSGSGPFVFEGWLRDTKLNIVGVRLKRNDEYFGGRPHLDAIEFCPYFTLSHFLNGEIESMPLISESLLKPGYQIFEDGSLQAVFLGMSCHLPPLDSLMIRKAIYHAVDRKALLSAVGDIRYLRQRTNSYIPHRLPGFFPKEEEETFGLDRAKGLLQKGKGDDEGNRISLTLLFSRPRTEEKNRLYHELKRQLEQLGISLKLGFYRSSEEVKKFNKPYLILVSQLMDFPGPEDIIRPLFFSTSPSNLLGYSSPELDSLLQKAEIEGSWAERITLFHQIEQILFAEIPAIPLFYQQNRVVMQPYVRGVEVPPLGFYYLNLKKIWLDK